MRDVLEFLFRLICVLAAWTGAFYAGSLMGKTEGTVRAWRVGYEQGWREGFMYGGAEPEEYVPLQELPELLEIVSR